MDKTIWAKRVTDKLYAGERNLDSTIRSLTELLNEMQDAQADLGISPVSTNPTMMKVVEAMTALQDARTHLTAGHHRLEKLGKALRVRTEMSATPLKVSPDEEEVVVRLAEAV